jgi:hypothetical protein
MNELIERGKTVTTLLYKPYKILDLIDPSPRTSSRNPFLTKKVATSPKSRPRSSNDRFDIPVAFGSDHKSAIAI